MAYPPYSHRLDARTITTPGSWIDAFVVPAGETCIVRFLTVINTGAIATDVLLGFGSGHQVFKWQAVGPGAASLAAVWLVWEAGEAIQWQISASSVQTSLHGQLLTAS